MNILEAVHLDISSGYDANARVGLALAAAVTTETYIDEHRLDWALGGHWIDGYVTWNMAFVLSHISRSKIAKLMIPSVACYDERGEDWFSSRSVSLSLNVMLLPNSPDPSLGIPAGDAKRILRCLLADETNAIMRQSYASSFGNSNLELLLIDPPTLNDIEEMLFTLCDGMCHDGSWSVFSDSIMHARMSDDDFKVYAGMIYWITIVGTGIGLEFWVWLAFFSPSNGRTEVWSRQWEYKWYLAQGVFSLLVAASIGCAMHGNFLSMPILSLAVWKFGLPETLMYMCLGVQDVAAPSAQRLADILNGVGLVVHHAAMALSIAMLLAEVIQAERALLSPALILIMQHWFVIVKYMNRSVYIIIEIILEVFFEWMLLSQFEYFSPNHWSAALIGSTILIAHWFFLIAGGIEFLIDSMNRNEIDRACASEESNSKTDSKEDPEAEPMFPLENQELCKG